jgi:hypothetical protein
MTPEDAAAFEAIFPAPTTSDYFRFALMACEADGVTPFMGLLVTVNGKTWSHVLSWMARVAGGESLDTLHYDLNMNVMPLKEDAVFAINAMSSTDHIKRLVASLTGSYQQSGPTKLEALHLPKDADPALVQSLVVTLLEQCLPPDAKPTKHELSLLNKDLKPVLTVDCLAEEPK